MISEFLNSWPMFSQSYLAALFAGLLLSFLGVIVVARAQVFIAAAVAQASMLGIALDMLLNTGQPAAFSVAFSVMAALATGTRTQRGGTSHEEITAWIFLIGASGSILLLAKHPNGLKSVQATMASSIIGAAAVDVLVVCCPLLPETRDLVNAKVLDALGRGNGEGYLINVARGPVVNQAALIAALTEKRIAGAGLDVYWDEPRVPPALLGLDNVVLAPHVGTHTQEVREERGRMVLANLAAHFAGKPVPHLMPENDNRR